MTKARALRRTDRRTAWERRSLDRLGGRALERSKRIIRAAHELVAEGGLEAVSLRPLLLKSGLSRRAFYERFEGMDDVLLALFEDTMARGAAGLAERTRKVEGALAKIEALVRTMASPSSAARSRVFLLAMSSEHARLAELRPQELREATLPMDRMIAGILEEGMREGAVRKADPDRLAEMLHALVASEVHRNLHLGRPDESWIDELCDFCLHAVGAGRATPAPGRRPERTIRAASRRATRSASTASAGGARLGSA
jgi:AcrR family transcriptional regulator